MSSGDQTEPTPAQAGNQSAPSAGMPSSDPNKQNLIWIGLVVLAFIAGAVATMAGLHSVQVPSKPQPTTQSH